MQKFPLSSPAPVPMKNTSKCRSSRSSCSRSSSSSSSSSIINEENNVIVRRPVPTHFQSHSLEVDFVVDTASTNSNTNRSVSVGTGAGAGVVGAVAYSPPASSHQNNNGGTTSGCAYDNTTKSCEHNTASASSASTSTSKSTINATFSAASRKSSHTSSTLLSTNAANTNASANVSANPTPSSSLSSSSSSSSRSLFTPIMNHKASSFITPTTSSNTRTTFTTNSKGGSFSIYKSKGGTNSISFFHRYNSNNSCNTNSNSNSVSTTITDTNDTAKSNSNNINGGNRVHKFSNLSITPMNQHYIHPGYNSTTRRSSGGSTRNYKPNQTNNDNLSHQQRDHYHRHHHSHNCPISIVKSKSTTISHTPIRASPFEPIVNDRQYQCGKISPLSMEEYEAWIAKRNYERRRSQTQTQLQAQAQQLQGQGLEQKGHQHNYQHQEEEDCAKRQQHQQQHHCSYTFRPVVISPFDQNDEEKYKNNSLTATPANSGTNIPVYENKGEATMSTCAKNPAIATTFTNKSRVATNNDDNDVDDTQSSSSYGKHDIDVSLSFDDEYESDSENKSISSCSSSLKSKSPFKYISLRIVQKDEEAKGGSNFNCIGPGECSDNRDATIDNSDGRNIDTNHHGANYFDIRGMIDFNNESTINDDDNQNKEGDNVHRNDDNEQLILCSKMAGSTILSKWQQDEDCAKNEELRQSSKENGDDDNSLDIGNDKRSKKRSGIEVDVSLSYTSTSSKRCRLELKEEE